MILVANDVGSREMTGTIRRLGVPVQLSELEFSDACFEGNGPKGSTMIGVECKRIHDMLDCIDSSRYVDHQRKGMAQMFGVSILNVEGNWRAHDPDGWLMEGFRKRDGEMSWGYCKPGGRPVKYEKLYRYLLSIALSGVIITYSRDLFGTAFNICEIYHYFQKQWDEHTSLLSIHAPSPPDMRDRPSLVRRWAYALTDVGAKTSIDLERRYKTGGDLADATEDELLQVPGIGKKTAKQIVREIAGFKVGRR